MKDVHLQILCSPKMGVLFKSGKFNFAKTWQLFKRRGLAEVRKMGGDVSTIEQFQSGSSKITCEIC
jgi:hypothetical protein